MGRRKRTRMIIKDIQVTDGKCIISVEIRRGSHFWRRAYGFTADALDNWDFETFKQRILTDALKLDEDQHFEDRVLMRLEHVMDTTIFLD